VSLLHHGEGRTSEDLSGGWQAAPCSRPRPWEQLHFLRARLVVVRLCARAHNEHVTWGQSYGRSVYIHRYIKAELFKVIQSIQYHVILYNITTACLHQKELALPLAGHLTVCTNMFATQRTVGLLLAGHMYQPHMPPPEVVPWYLRSARTNVPHKSSAFEHAIPAGALSLLEWCPLPQSHLTGTNPFRRFWALTYIYIDIIPGTLTDLSLLTAAGLRRWHGWKLVVLSGALWVFVGKKSALKAWRSVTYGISAAVLPWRQALARRFFAKS